MAQNYERLPLVEFGKILFDSRDLDPTYCALVGAKLPYKQLCRWLVSYWCYYSSGFASYASERTGKEFWKLLQQAAVNETETPIGGRWPRGAERRHFRGQTAIKAVAALQRRYGEVPEGLVDYLASGPMNVRAVIARVMEHPYFGNWIGFKAADMLDAVVGKLVNQDDVSVFLYDTPHASILANFENGVLPKPRTKADQEKPLEFAMEWLREQLSDCRIPHKPKSFPDWFSIETVWCKHLSHVHGHYPISKDLEEITHGVEPWVKASSTAKKFLAHMPKVPEKPSIWNLT